MNQIGAKQLALMERRVNAARMWRLGYSLREIADRLEIASGTAWNDIHDTRCRLLLQEGVTKEDKRVAGWFEQEVYKHEALRAWERSKQDAIEIIEEPDPTPEDPDHMKVVQVKRVGQCGDASYLKVAQKAEERQARIYGTDVDPKALDPFSQESEEEQDGSRTYRGVVDGRDEANESRGSRRVIINRPAATEAKEETPPAPDQALVPKARRPVRRPRKDKGVRRGKRLRKK